MKWNKVPYVYGYKIYRLDKSTNTYKHVGTTVGASNTSFTDKGLEVETLYSYKVLAFYGTNSGAYNGGESNIVHAATQEKNIDKVSIAKRAKDSLTLEWTPQTEVSGYHIVRFNPATGKYKTVAYVKGAKTILTQIPSWQAEQLTLIKCVLTLKKAAAAHFSNTPLP